MKPLLLIAITILAVGCGEKNESTADTKPAEAVSVNPNLKYKIKDDTVTITGCDKKASGAVIIPATIEGKSVTSLGGEVFVECESLTAVTFLGDAPKIASDTFGGRPVKLISEKP